MSGAPPESVPQARVRRCIARRWDDPAIALGQGGCHEGMPRGLITGLSQLCHKKKVALWVHRDEAQATGTRFVLGHREVFWGHVLGQAWGLGVAVGNDRLFNLEVHLLLSPIGGGHKAVKAGEVEEETHQAHAACPDFDAEQMEGKHQAVSECQSGTALQELGDMVADIERIVPDTPGLQGRSGNLELLGSLTLGETLKLATPGTAQRGPHVRIDPSVAGSHG